MNYIVKAQQTSCSVGSVVIGRAKCVLRFNFCENCLRRYSVFWSNSKHLSTYASVLKLILKKKKTFVGPYKSSRVLQSATERNKNNVYTDLPRLVNNKGSKKKMVIKEIKANEVPQFAEGPGLAFEKLKEKKLYMYDSSRSYDSNLVYDNGYYVAYQEILNLETQNDSFISNTENQRIGEHSNSLITNSVKLKTLMKNESLMRSALSKTKDALVLNAKRKADTSVNSKGKKPLVKPLPLTSVEVFPMPKSLQKNIAKKSAEALKKLNADDKINRISNSKLKANWGLVPLDLKAPLEKPSDKEFYKEFEETYVGVTKVKEVTTDKKQKSFQLLHSYIDVAISNNMVEDALDKFIACRKASWWSNVDEEKDVVDMYNLLLHSFSQQGNWIMVNKVANWMSCDNVKYNIKTYAAFLDALGRVSSEVFETDTLKKKKIASILVELQKKHFKINDLFTKTNLTKEQTENILNTIRRVLPSFEIEPTKIQLNSDCDLVKNLYLGYNELKSPLEKDLTPDFLGKLVDEQLILEKNFKLQVKAVTRNESSKSVENSRRKFALWLKIWREKVEKAFLERLASINEKSKKQTGSDLRVYLNSLPPAIFVDSIMETVRNLVEYSGGHSPSTSWLYNVLGSKIHRRYQIKKKIDNSTVDLTEKLFKKYCSWLVQPEGPAMNTRQEWQMLMQDYTDGRQLDTKIIPWPEAVRKAMGKWLFKIILDEVKIKLNKSHEPEKSIPVFHPVLRYKELKCSEEIKCHPIVANVFKKVGFEYINFDADQVPMVCPPKPWKNIDHGGYLILPTDFVRQPQPGVAYSQHLRKFSSKEMYSNFDALNSLQTVPWMVNEDVLDIALEVFQNGGNVPLGVPKFPDTDPLPPLNLTEDMDTQSRIEEYKKRLSIVRQRHNEYGLWCEALYRLSLANHFRNRPFWLPQNFDFRGRVYPVPPHLNHLGADFFRSLLIFAKGKPLGPNGLDWIKIHTINLTGTHKKKSVKERLDYANEILPEILDSAEKPLTGRQWWTKSDEPWQTLAACIEIKKVLDSPNQESYKCRFPVHQDGSCNGLQHYAALGRDIIGATSVNLSNSKVPQDVYSAVTEIIEQERSKDAEEGVEIAKILEGFVNRKVVKQTVMTTVYGVTKYGARLQISGQLEDIPNFPKEYVWKAAEYLTGKTFLSLEKMFTSAKEIQDWFIKCAKFISHNNQYVQWITPLGLPVLQPYYKETSKAQTRKNGPVSPNVLKQKNAFPPNFIHSLDSCHMMLTTLNCEQKGLTFAAIHDCFWTHPCSVETMNKICREQFIALHSQPILDDLSKFFINSYVQKDAQAKDAVEIFTAIPKKGNFNLNEVMESVYFFS